MKLEEGSLADLENKVAVWAAERGLMKEEFVFRQLAKAMEELGEVASALCKDKPIEDFEDGVGDTLVTLIILARQKGTTITEALTRAYDVIKNRKGVTRGGTFIKDEDLAAPLSNKDNFYVTAQLGPAYKNYQPRPAMRCGNCGRLLIDCTCE